MIGGQFMENWLRMPEKLKECCREDSPYLVHSDFFRFFCCYLAFNHLYDCVNYKNPRREPFLSETLSREKWSTRSEDYKRKWHPSDRERILALIDKAVKKIKRACGNSEEWREFEQGVDNIMFKPVVESRIRDIDEDRTHRDGGCEYNEAEHPLIGDIARSLRDCRDNGLELRLKLQMVFLRIYQVRCNLFHGDKDPNRQRDIDLVKASADVLEKFLWFVVRDCHGEIW